MVLSFQPAAPDIDNFHARESCTGGVSSPHAYLLVCPRFLTALVPHPRISSSCRAPALEAFILLPRRMPRTSWPGMRKGGVCGCGRIRCCGGPGAAHPRTSAHPPPTLEDNVALWLLLPQRSCQLALVVPRLLCCHPDPGTTHAHLPSSSFFCAHAPQPTRPAPPFSLFTPDIHREGIGCKRALVSPYARLRAVPCLCPDPPLLNGLADHPSRMPSLPSTQY
ncbi:hypothetical protein B0H10DRAFT_2235564 [Mycena sp. CBHHK59/15]|nr:hypothetical protein B0H10DRAFT_2235564 [Mycena sp. CBHHK59/15]